MLRKTTAFKALNLLFDSYRHTSLNDPPQPITGTPTPPITSQSSAILHHLLYLVIHKILFDVFTLPTDHLIPLLHPVLGLSAPLGRVLWGAIYMLASWCGVCQLWHLFMFLGLVTGIYGYDDCDQKRKLMDKPWKADSVNDFWGKRWHSFMRVGQLYCTKGTH
jgi:hypothetical protein